MATETAISDIVINANLGSGGASFATQQFRQTVTDNATGNAFSYSLGGYVTLDRGTHGVSLAEFSRNAAFTAIHEFGHALGFSSAVWNDLGLNTIPGQFSGITAINTFKSEYGAAVSGFDHVPLENSSGVIGTDGIHLDGDFAGGYDGLGVTDYANKLEYGLFLDESHPDELIRNIFLNTGGASNFGIRPTQAGDKIRFFTGDVMSGVIGLGGKLHLSDTTIAAFEDMGYDTILTVPEPSSLSFLAICGGLLFLRRRPS